MSASRSGAARGGRRRVGGARIAAGQQTRWRLRCWPACHQRLGKQAIVVVRQGPTIGFSQPDIARAMGLLATHIDAVHGLLPVDA